MQEPRSMNLSGFDAFTPHKLFLLTSVVANNVRLRLKRLPIPTNIITDDLMEEPESISLRTISGNVNVNVDERYSTEMERITKNKPPPKTTIQMIFSEFVNSIEGNISQIFKDLLPYPEK
ncbi:13979_t:CDS:1 [Funneliformis geosporum]|nr:13979_t:CDS:1 [Funneliformis geosporum]